jgi:hypothetical protein
MNHKTLIFLHGFLSSAQGTKVRFLRQKLAGKLEVDFHAVEFNPTPRDFEFMTVTGQINRLRQYVLDHRLEPVSLIGSSLGGLVALHYAHRYGGVAKLLLLAPALGYEAGPDPAGELKDWQASGLRRLWHDGLQAELPLRYEYHLDRLRFNPPPPPPVDTIILHGLNDEVVPIAGSRQYAAAYPARVRLREVDSDHRLSDQLDRIWREVEATLL